MNTNNPTKIFSWKTAILLCLGVGLLSAGLSIFFQTQGQTILSSRRMAVEPQPVAAVSTVESQPAVVGSGSSFETPGQPVRLLIPAIGVNAAIQSVGLSWHGNGDMGVPTNFTDVGWYDQGPLPGAPGSAVIDGHLDGKYVPKAVFYDLGRLKQGDMVMVVDQKGKTWQFQVIASEAYPYDASTTNIFAGGDSKARLNLITCAGDWIKSQGLYNQRVVVFTELVTVN
jgi:sortase (surface protein transpeptidase)